MATRKYQPVPSSGQSPAERINPNPSPNLSLSESHLLLRPETRIPVNLAKIQPESTNIGSEWIRNEAERCANSTLEGCIVRVTQAMLNRMPIEQYEQRLFEATRVYTEVLGSPPVRFDCLEAMHHLVQLRKQEETLSPEQQRDLVMSTESALSANPLILEEYRLFERLVGISAGLMVKWNLTWLGRFSYRTVSTSFYQPSSSTESLLTIDTFWLSQALGEPPFSLSPLDELLILAKLLQLHTVKTFTSLLSLNREFLGIPDNFPSFRRLRMPTGLSRLCHKCPKPLAQLRISLIELEASYISFEKKLVSALSNPQGLRRELA